MFYLYIVHLSRKENRDILRYWASLLEDPYIWVIIVTVDEIFVFPYEPETKPRSSVWTWTMSGTGNSASTNIEPYQCLHSVAFYAMTLCWLVSGHRCDW